MTFERFSRLGLDDTPDDDPHPHRPYYAFRTREINSYIGYDVNRWLIGLEALICRVDPGPGGLAPASAEQQMINGVMVTTIMRTLRAKLSEQEYRSRRSLWLHSWRSKPRPEGDASGSEAEEGSEPTIVRRGLDYVGSVERTGLAWLPTDLILWEGLPTFKPDIFHRLGVAYNGFGGRLNQTLRVQTLLQQEHRELALYREWLQRSLTLPKRSPDPHGRRWVFRVGAELIIQSYQLEILGILRRRSQETNPRIDIVQERWDAIQSKGLQGFSYDLLITLLLAPPHVVLVKKKARRGRSLLDQYWTGHWIDRVAGLFGLDDDRLGATTKRGWEHSPFRVLKRRLQHIVVDVLGRKAERTLEKVINLHACQKMLIIPQYDLDKLSVLRKTRNIALRRTLEEMGLLGRTNWTMPKLELCHARKMQVLEEAAEDDELFDSDLDRFQREIHEELTTRADRLAILAEGDRNQDSGMVKSPMRYGVDTKLNLAIEFRNQLKENQHG